MASTTPPKRKAPPKRGRRQLPREIRKEISERLSEFVHQRYDTRHRFEQVEGFNHSTVVSWFNPRRYSTPDTATLVQLAREKNLSLHWLLLGEGPEMRGTTVPTESLWDALRQAVVAELVGQGATHEEAGALVPRGKELFQAAMQEPADKWHQVLKRRREDAEANRRRKLLGLPPRARSIGEALGHVLEEE